MSEFQEQNNKSIVRRFYSEVLNAGNFGSIESMVREDFIDNSGYEIQQGIVNLLKRVSSLRSSIQDFMVEIQEMIAEGDRVVVKWRAKGLIKSEYLGLKAEEKRIDVEGYDIFRMLNSKIRERWQVLDSLQVYQQLGLINKDLKKVYF